MGLDEPSALIDHAIFSSMSGHRDGECESYIDPEGAFGNTVQHPVHPKHNVILRKDLKQLPPLTHGPRESR